MVLLQQISCFLDNICDREPEVSKYIFRGGRFAEAVDCERVAEVADVFSPAEGDAGFDGESGFYI